MYKAVFQLNSKEEKIINGTLTNMLNALQDNRLSGQLELVLVVHGDGADVYKKSSGHKETLRKLLQRNVRMTLCTNTIISRNIDKNDLFDFVEYLPSAAGELIILGQTGWTIIHP